MARNGTMNNATDPDLWYEISDALQRLEDALCKADSTFRQIRHGLFGPKEYVHIYTATFDICTNYGQSEDLYDYAAGRLETFLSSRLLPTLCENLKNIQFLTYGMEGSNESLQLNEIYKCWINFQIFNKWCSKFFQHVDRSYAVLRKLPTVDMIGTQHFKSIIYPEIKDVMTKCILNIIQYERDGTKTDVDKSIIKSIVMIYGHMGGGTLDLYNADLEEQLLENTVRFYLNKRIDWIDSKSTSDYLIQVEISYENERLFAQEYLNSSTECKILQIVNKELLEDAEFILLGKITGRCRSLLLNDKLIDLERMFRLYQRITSSSTGLTLMANRVQDFIEEKGFDIINRRQDRIEKLLADQKKEKNEDIDFIIDMIGLYKKYSKIVREQFSNKSVFDKSFTDAFNRIMNKSVGKYSNAELLASYCDVPLRTGSPVIESDIDHVLDDIVQLFMHLSDKDYFAEIYRNFLSKRLLNQRSRSRDIEKMMLAKLKVKSGSQFTSKMEGMLNDLSVSEDEHQLYMNRNNQQLSENANCDIKVQVLTLGLWPACIKTDVTVPSDIRIVMDDYAKWYKHRNPSRSLNWTLSQGSAIVSGTYQKNKMYDFQVTSLQAFALNAFTNGTTLSYEELAQRMNLSEEILKPLMHSLSCGKHKVIIKSPTKKIISTADTFRANPKFKCDNRKVRILMASLENSNESTIFKVNEERAYIIEAAIVRIMKARKALSHNDLKSNVLKQLQGLFNPTPRDVKGRIESLIEREYLERRDDDRNFYHYLA